MRFCYSGNMADRIISIDPSTTLLTPQIKKYIYMIGTIYENMS